MQAWQTPAEKRGIHSFLLSHRQDHRDLCVLGLPPQQQPLMINASSWGQQVQAVYIVVCPLGALIKELGVFRTSGLIALKCAETSFSIRITDATKSQ